MFKLTKKKVAAGIVAAGMIAGTGVGYAYWTANGSGTGTASTKTNITVTLAGNAVSNLVPGVAQTITGTVTPSDSATSAYVGTITPVFAASQAAAWHVGCSAADFELTTQAINDVVTSGATKNFGTIKLVDDPLNDQSACKNQPIALSFSSN